MNSAHWQKIKQALIELQDTDNPELVLAKIKAQEPEIASEVARLFQFKDSLGDFLEPSGGHDRDQWLEELQLELGDNFTDFEQVGVGGSGLVYRARQLRPVPRHVAIKVMDTRLLHYSVRQRFQMERESLASLNHPHISVIHSAGESSQGFQYLVMEWIDGQPITAYCDTASLSLSERLVLFTQVTSAVQFAHQNGILHRDLKPSNILVADSADGPQAKVIDFGIATRLNPQADARITRDLGVFPGTLPYVAPERLRHPDGSPDTQTDVYALGIVLFELLVGGRPFMAASSFDLAHAVMNLDPKRPSRHLRDLPGSEAIASARNTSVKELCRALSTDLDWVVCQAIERDPERRYATVSELSHDLQRERTGLPVNARPPDWPYLMRKFVKRHAALALAASVLVATMCLSSVGFYVLYQRSESARQAETRARQQTEKEAHRTQAVAQFLEDMLRAPDPSHMGEDARVIDFLDRSAEDVQSRFADDPETLAQALISLGDTYLSLGSFDKAEVHYLNALQLMRDDVESARMHNKLGRHAIFTAQYESAARHLNRAHQLSLERPDMDPGLGLTIRYNLAILAEETGDLRGSFRELKILEKPIKELQPYDASLYFACVASIARVQSCLGKFKEAEQNLKTILKLQSEQFGESHPETLTTLFDLGKVLRNQGRFAEAETIHRRELALSTEVQGAKHPETLVSQEALVRTLIAQHKFEEARPLAEENLSLFLEVLGREHAFTPYAAFNHAQVLADSGEWALAEQQFLMAIEISLASAYVEEQGINRFRQSYAEFLMSIQRESDAGEQMRLIRESSDEPEVP